MPHLVLVALGGAAGAMLRYLLARAIEQANVTSFPLGVLTVNSLGGLLMGIVVGAAGFLGHPASDMRVFLAIGLLGGFTTFSSFSLEAVLLLERGAFWQAMVYIVASVAISIAALYAAMRFTRWFLG